MPKTYTVGIYTNDEHETLAHVVDTIEDASRWIGVTVDALYKSKHLHDFMNAKGYKIELIQEPKKTNKKGLK